MKIFAFTVMGVLAQDYVDPAVITTTAFPFTLGDGATTTDGATTMVNGVMQRKKNKNNKNNKYKPAPTAPPTQAPYQPEPVDPVTQVVPVTSTDDQCWTCHEPTLQACAANGMVKACRTQADGNSNVCMIEVRKRDGDLFAVTMGCKDETACINERDNNFMFGRRPKLNQCRPDRVGGPSVCRNCCRGKNCFGTKVNNYVLGPESSMAEWAKDFLGGSSGSGGTQSGNSY